MCNHCCREVRQQLQQAVAAESALRTTCDEVTADKVQLFAKVAEREQELVDLKAQHQQHTQLLNTQLKAASAGRQHAEEVHGVSCAGMLSGVAGYKVLVPYLLQGFVGCTRPNRICLLSLAVRLLVPWPCLRLGVALLYQSILPAPFSLSLQATAAAQQAAHAAADTAEATEQRLRSRLNQQHTYIHTLQLQLQRRIDAVTHLEGQLEHKTTQHALVAARERQVQQHLESEQQTSRQLAQKLQEAEAGRAEAQEVRKLAWCLFAAGVAASLYHSYQGL
jgi:hypothetical protein